MKSKVGIVVVTYNRLTLLKEVIDSLREQEYKDFDIIVVNNGSTDGTSEWLSEQTDLQVINQVNTGGAGGFFAGMKYVAEGGYEYCWIMDDDVVCHADALSELVAAYHRKPNIGFVCSKVVGMDNRPMNIPLVDARSTSKGNVDFVDLIEYQMIRVSMATFVSVFLSTATIKNVGLPYKEYFIWGDDSEYTHRISDVYDCYMACKSVVVHKRAIQSGLSFETETDPNRIKMFFYYLRNNCHNRVLWGESTTFKQYMKLMKMLLRYICKFDITRCSVILKVMRSLVLFHPSIQFPSK